MLMSEFCFIAEKYKFNWERALNSSHFCSAICIQNKCRLIVAVELYSFVAVYELKNRATNKVICGVSVKL